MKNKPLPACGISKPLLGEILINGGFITFPTLQAAMGKQKDTRDLLGEVLLRMGALQPGDLRVVLALQKNLASLKDTDRFLVGVWGLLTDLFIKGMRVSATKDDSGPAERQKAHDKLGEILVRYGFVSKHVVNVVLAFQKDRRGTAKASGPCRLGDILVATEQITRHQLREALSRQKNSKKKISALLLKTGCARTRQLEHNLNLAQMRAAAPIITVLFMANMLLAEEACAGSAPGLSSSQQLTVTAVVLEHTSMQVMNQVQQVVVTNADIGRGYVDVSAATRINVKSNDPRGFVLIFEVVSGTNSLFDSVSVSMGGREVLLSPSGGLISVAYVGGGLTMDLSYRFILSQNAQPDTYPWPLSIGASPL